MRNTQRLKDLELKVIKMEMTIELLTLSINNLMESQEMVITDEHLEETVIPTLDAGKWYKKP